MSVIARKPVEQPGVVTVAGGYLKRPAGVRNLCFQPVIRSLSWADWAVGISKPLKSFKFHLVQGRGILYWADFPGNIRRFSSAVRKFGSSFSTGNVPYIFQKTAWVGIHAAHTAALGASVFEIAHHEKWLTLTTKQLSIVNTLGVIGSCAMFISAAVRIKKVIVKLLNSPAWSPQFNLALIRLISSTLLATLATFAMIGFTFGPGHIPVLASLIVATVFLGTSVGSYFYNEMSVKPLEQNT